MSTRGVIAFRWDDGSITASYCHNDNYLEGTGRALLKYWNSAERADELASHGYMSIVASDIEDIVEQSSHAQPAEEDMYPYQFADVVEMGKSDVVANCDYVYMYIPDRGWMVARGFTEILLFVPLTEAIRTYAGGRL